MTHTPRWARDARNGDVIDREEAVKANFEILMRLPYIERQVIEIDNLLPVILEEVRRVRFDVRILK